MNRLREAVAVANIPSLIPVLVQLTGDERWLEDPYRPTRGRGLNDHDDGGLPEARAGRDPRGCGRRHPGVPRRRPGGDPRTVRGAARAHAVGVDGRGHPARVRPDAAPRARPRARAGGDDAATPGRRPAAGLPGDRDRGRRVGDGDGGRAGEGGHRLHDHREGRRRRRHVVAQPLSGVRRRHARATCTASRSSTSTTGRPTSRCATRCTTTSRPSPPSSASGPTSACSTEVVGARYSEADQSWDVDVRTADGTTETLRADALDQCGRRVRPARDPRPPRPRHVRGRAGPHRPLAGGHRPRRQARRRDRQRGQRHAARAGDRRRCRARVRVHPLGAVGGAVREVPLARTRGAAVAVPGGPPVPLVVPAAAVLELQRQEPQGAAARSRLGAPGAVAEPPERLPPGVLHAVHPRRARRPQGRAGAARAADVPAVRQADADGQRLVPDADPRRHHAQPDGGRRRSARTPSSPATARSTRSTCWCWPPGSTSCASSPRWSSSGAPGGRSARRGRTTTPGPTSARSCPTCRTSSACTGRTCRAATAAAC